MPKPGKGHLPRLPTWDYSTEGAYFVTFNVARRRRLLGCIGAGQVVASVAGHIVRECWSRLPDRFGEVRLDEMVVMPDHVHAIVWIGDTLMYPHHRHVTPSGVLDPLMSEPGTTLGKVIRAWKAESTRRIRCAGLTHFAWQSRYHERVIRTDAELRRTRRYIRDNPLARRA